MNKITNFDEWFIAVSEVLELDKKLILIDKFINNKRYCITLEQFYNTIVDHTGWQPTIMKMVDYFCANKLFHNGMNYTKKDISNTKTLVLDYYADFIINAIQAGYEFCS